MFVFASSKTCLDTGCSCIASSKTCLDTGCSCLLPQRHVWILDVRVCFHKDMLATFSWQACLSHGRRHAASARSKAGSICISSSPLKDSAISLSPLQVRVAHANISEHFKPFTKEGEWSARGHGSRCSRWAGRTRGAKEPAPWISSTAFMDKHMPAVLAARAAVPTLGLRGIQADLTQHVHTSRLGKCTNISCKTVVNIALHSWKQRKVSQNIYTSLPHICND